MTVEDTIADPSRLPRCFDCGLATCWMPGRYGPFVACTGYKKCRWTLSKAALARMLAKRAVGTSVAAARAKKFRTRADTASTMNGSR